MPKQTLQQKIRHALGRFTAKRIAMILLGTAILSFGIHNIHQRTAITEGGVIGLVLLINHWLGVPGVGGVAPARRGQLRAGVQISRVGLFALGRGGQREPGRVL